MGPVLKSPFLFPFSSGQEVQRISVITNLPDLLRDHHDDCMRRVVPKVRVSLRSQMCLLNCDGLADLTITITIRNHGNLNLRYIYF